MWNINEEKNNKKSSDKGQETQPLVSSLTFYRVNGNPLALLKIVPLIIN